MNRAPLAVIELKRVNSVVIDGQSYEVRNQEELSVFDRRRLLKMSAVLEGLEALEEPTDDQRSQYDEALAEVIRLMVAAPVDVITTLRTGERVRLVLAIYDLFKTWAGKSTESAHETPAASEPQSPPAPAAGALV